MLMHDAGPSPFARKVTARRRTVGRLIGSALAQLDHDAHQQRQKGRRRNTYDSRGHDVGFAQPVKHGRILLVEEVAGAGEVHGDSCGVGCGNHFFITDGSAGLDHGADTGVEQNLQTVGEREERVRGRHCAA